MWYRAFNGTNVVKVSKSLSSGIAVCTVECEHKSYELNNDEYKLKEMDFEGAPSECLISLLQGTSMTAGICDPTIPIKLKINRECTRRAALMQLIALCGGEIEYSGNEINIRSHRGSQEYINIMDGKNASNLTMETDNRSQTTNYGLTLYKNVDFSVGDNVNIVFRPFDLNVSTRIISMSFNPFNRREISIEVGDYIPSISDNLYRIEEKTDNIRNDVDNATAAVKISVNNSKVSITEKQQRLLRVTLNAIKATYAVFCATVKFEITNVGTVVFVLKKDKNEAIRYVEQFDEGAHTKTFSYPFVSEEGINDTELQTYNIGYYYTRMNDTAPYIYRWFYGTGVNGDYNNALSAFEWDDKYFVITKYPLINGSEVTSTNNYGQLRVFTKDGKSTGKVFQYVGDGTLSNMTAASFWGFYVDEKTNTPLILCDSCNIPYSMLALEIIKSGEDYGRYRMRISMPTYSSNYMYTYGNLIKTEGVSLPLYIAPFYPYNNSGKHFFGFALGIFKTCLTTINNLSEPVRKLDGQVMKITYDIVDE